MGLHQTLNEVEMRDGNRRPRFTSARGHILGATHGKQLDETASGTLAA
jgi:hypothetical protein